MPERRRLSFTGIAAIMPEVDRLVLGHRTVGNWSLGMICDHLARTITLTLDMPPSAEEPTRAQKVARRLFFRAEAFPEGQDIPLPDLQTPSAGADGDPGDAVAALRRALVRLEAAGGPFATHPRLGPLGRDEWLTFHARHAAHHLGFAVPD